MATKKKKRRVPKMLKGKRLAKEAQSHNALVRRKARDGTLG
jgi:hypothetical protein